MGCLMSGGIFEFVREKNRYPCMLKQLICPNNKDHDTELNHADPDPEFSIKRNNGFQYLV